MEALGRRCAGRLRRRPAGLNVFAAPAILSAGYQGFALVSALRKWREPALPADFLPPVSILKPVRGCDEGFFDAVASHAALDYPHFEILFGVSDPADPACAALARLAREFPAVPIRLVLAPNDAPNGKVGVLQTLAREARYPFLLVNDADIRVAPNYLREVMAPLADAQVGLVTCLYRGVGGSFAARSEALGVATEFAPSVLVARQAGVNEFAMGSTLAFRAADLDRIGGFAAIRDYLADDYQLGLRLTRLGLRVVLGRPVVGTWLGAGGWPEVWRHQVRWARTIRISRTAGYVGYAITHALLWALVAAFSGNLAVAALCYLMRVVAGLFIAAAVVNDRPSLRLSWWLPARDLLGVAVWIAGLFGDRVEWRGHSLTIDSQGRIRPR